MKKGDVVTINDFSYSRIIEGGKLSSGFNISHHAAGEQFTVVETGCIFPAYGNQVIYCSGEPGTFNNTVIQAIDSDKVVFIEERFLTLVLPTHEVVVDMDYRGCVGIGTTYTISDKLYQEIKREPQTK